jgi:MoaA/NifB/PqqE/SkfB family radical SAM enzyme
MKCWSILLNSICLLPWIHLEAEANGKAKPCCIYNSAVGNFNTQTLDEIWNSSNMQELRQQFLDGKTPIGCAGCTSTEQAGNESKRITDNKRFDHHKNKPYEELQLPVYMDLKFGTVCNLKCRTCSTASSFKWAEDETELFGQPLNKDLKSYWISDDKPIWNDLEKLLPTVEFFDFTGGEPLLIKKHYELLRKAVKLGYAKNIKIHYNTNGTIMPPPDMFKIWKEFKHVEVMFSIDGIRDKFEYMRHPAKWDTFLNTLSIFKEKNFASITLCHTISAFNIYYVDEFLEWASDQGFVSHEIYLNLLHYPDHESISNLSLEVKDKIKQKLTGKGVDSIIDFMYTSDKDLTSNFLDFVKRVDLIRGEEFAKTFDEYNTVCYNIEKRT